jgi:hypothetical protein
MREMGAPIKFDPFRETYYYCDDGGFVIRFQRNGKKSINSKLKTAS